MRIALTNPLCWPEVRRGAERFVPGLGAALARRGHDVVHFSAAWESGNETADGVETVRLRRRFEDLTRHEADFGRRVLPHLVRRDFDVVHSLSRHDAVASIRAARIRRGRRTVFTDLGIPTRAYWTTRGRRQAWSHRKVVNHIDVYSGMSRWAVDSLAREFGREDGVVVPGGVDRGHFVPAPERAPKPTVLFSGAFTVPFKEVALLLKALPIVAREEPEVRLWLSGPGDATDLLAAAPPEARERTEVLGLGEADSQHERYGRAWATCLPSRHDSFGMVLVESLACGTPLVTTTEGAPQELVDEGRTGSLCEPGNEEDLARACLQTLQIARRPETVDACRDSAGTYDWDDGLAPLVERIYAGD